MYKAFLALVSWVLVATITGAFTPARAASDDPEIGSAISGFKLKLTEFDDVGDFSIKRVCRKGELKYFTFDAGFKPGVKGRFAQIDTSLVRLKLSDGEVIKMRGLAVDASRRLLAFTLSAPMSSRKATIDLSGHNYLVLTVKGGAGPGDIMLTPVASFCVKQARPTL